MDRKSLKLDFGDGDERRFPLALVLALLLQAATIVWWAAGKERDVFFLTQRVTALEGGEARFSADMAEIKDRLVRVEERQGATLRLLDQIDKRLNH